MGEELLLFGLLVLLYLAECVRWVPRNAVAFVAPFGRGWRGRVASLLWSNQRGRLLLLNPLPPLGAYLLSQPWPLSFSPQGLASYTSQAYTKHGPPQRKAKVMRYEDIDRVDVASTTLLVNGSHFVTCQSAETAHAVASCIAQLSRQSEDQRARSLEERIALMLDVRNAEETLRTFRQKEWSLRLGCNALFVLLFVLAPLWVWRVGPAQALAPVLGAWLVLHLAVLVRFYLLHKEYYPSSWDARAGALLNMTLCPPAAIRALDDLSRNLLANVHPVAVMRAVGTPDQFRAFLRVVLLDLRYPLGTAHLNDEALTIDARYRQTLAEQVTAFAKRRGVDPDLLLTPPPPDDPEVHFLCPRCWAEYTRSQGECGDCGGIKLVPIWIAQARLEPP